MRHPIDSPRVRLHYSQRFGTVEPVFENLGHNKRLSRLNRREQDKFRVQWILFCKVHNVEKLQRAGL